MTPQEKAVDLVDKFYQHTNTNSKERAKACALIAVDEIIKYHDDLMDVVRYELPSHIVAILPYKYWEEVRQEIEKL
jgi:hypothetical protein